MKKTTTLLIALLSAAGIAFAEGSAKASDSAGGAGNGAASAASSSKGASGSSGAHASGSSGKAKGDNSSGSSSSISPNEIPGIAWSPVLGNIPGFCGMNGEHSSLSSTAILSQTKCPKPPASTKVASSKTPAASPAETTGKPDSPHVRAESPDNNASGASGASGTGAAGGAKGSKKADDKAGNKGNAADASKNSSGSSGTSGSTHVSPAAPSTPTDVSGGAGSAHRSKGEDGLPKGSPKPANSGGMSGGS